MIRRLAIAALLVSAAGAAQAQSVGGPPIAYVKRASNGDEIHLISPDGSERVRIYKAKSKVQVTMLDLRPGGGEIAFTEGHTTLKILAFDSLGRPMPNNPREILRVASPCTIESPDYHPTNGSILFTRGCGRTREVGTVSTGESVPNASPLLASWAVTRARWSRLADSIYYVGLREGATSSDPTYLYRWTADQGPVEVGLLNNWSTFDVARTGERIFWGDEQGFKMLDLSVSGATTSNAVPLSCPRGSRMTRSPDDTQMAFQSPWSRGKGNYVMISATNCSTDPTALTGQGSWGWIDWRAE
jgi:hypothetical protein